MKRSLFIVLLAALCYSMFSCTKTNNITTTIHDTTTIITRDTIVVTNPKNPIVGLWVGMQQIDGAPGAGEFYYTINLFADSTIIQHGNVQNGLAYSSSGTWSLSKDSIFTATIRPTEATQGSWTQHLSAKYSSKDGTLSNGIWSYTSGNTGSGTFSLQRTQ